MRRKTRPDASGGIQARQGSVAESTQYHARESHEHRVAVFIASLVMFAASAPATSATTYSDSSSFLAAVQEATTIDFEGLVGSPAYPSNHPFVAGAHMSTSPSGIVVEGVQFVGRVSFGTGFETYIFDSNPDSFNTSAVLWGGRGVLDLALASGTTAIGFEFGSNADLNVAITVTERSGGSLSVSRDVLADASQFFGYVGNEIAGVTINSGQTVGFTPYVMADNVTIAAAVPEPHESWLLLGGLAVLGALTRGRREARN